MSGGGRAAAHVKGPDAVYVAAVRDAGGGHGVGYAAASEQDDADEEREGDADQGDAVPGGVHGFCAGDAADARGAGSRPGGEEAGDSRVHHHKRDGEGRLGSVASVTFLPVLVSRVHRPARPRVPWLGVDPGEGVGVEGSGVQRQ